MDIKDDNKIDVSKWTVGRFTQQAILKIQEATLLKGDYRDTALRILISEEDRALFTLNVENRLLAMLRKIYNEVVLLEYETPEQKKRRLEVLMNARLRRAHAKKEKEHAKRLNIKL